MTKLLKGTGMVVWTCLWLSVSQASLAADKNVDVEQAIRSLKNDAWYDTNTDEYKSPKVKAAFDDPIRQNGWVKQEKLVNTQPWNWNWNWNWNFGGIGDVLGTIVLFVLGGLLIAVIAVLIYLAFRNHIGVGLSSRVEAKKIQVDMAKITELPFEVRATQGDPLNEAERLMNSGHYNEATIYLYSYMLLALDQSGVIELQKGKTNRMYLREIKSNPELRGIVNETMLAFEDVFFGRYDITQDRFMKLWGKRDRFHQLLAIRSGNENPNPNKLSQSGALGASL